MGGDGSDDDGDDDHHHSASAAWAGAAGAGARVRLVVPCEAPTLVALVQLTPTAAAVARGGGGASGDDGPVTLDPGNELSSRVALPRALGLALHLLLVQHGGRVGGVPARSALLKVLGGSTLGGGAGAGGAGEDAVWGILADN